MQRKQEKKNLNFPFHLEFCGSVAFQLNRYKLITISICVFFFLVHLPAPAVSEVNEWVSVFLSSIFVMYSRHSVHQIRRQVAK